ncbi:MAG: M23 family metallopeptidase, partial [Cyanobacteriota bacterium]
MTKETASGYTPLGIFYRSPRLMQGLCLISSLSVLGSGLVLAQTDSFQDSGNTPPSKAVEVAPAPAPEPAAKPKPAAPESIVVPVTPVRKSTPEPRASATPPTPAAARKPMISATPPAPAAARKPVIQTKPSSQRTVKKPVTRVRRSTQVVQRKPITPLPAEALGPRISVSKQPKLATPNLSLPDTATVQKPPKLYLNPAQIQETAKAPVGLTNRYIDRTDYSIGATSRYESPASVIVTDRSTGCRTVSKNGQLVSGACGGTAPTQLTATRATATRATTTRETATRETPTRETATRLKAIQLIAAQPRITKQISSEQIVGVQTAEAPMVISRRIIQEPRLAGVTKLVTASVAAAEPIKIGPVKVSLRSTRAPRQKTKTYTAYSTERLPSSIPQSYSLPQGQTSPQSYSLPQGQTSPMGLAYYNLTSRPAARPNVGNANFMFPLAVPAAITSMFGWRIHPVSGEYRFHAGTDLGAPTGTPVIAAVAGQVITADFLGGYGLTVVLQHEDGKNETLYGHLSEIFVQPGD